MARAAQDKFGAAGEKTRVGVASLLAAVAALVVFLAIAAPREAFAHISPCRGGSLPEADQQRLLQAARGVFPSHTVPVISNLCGSQYAEITTAKQLDRPGASHWWVTSCARDQGHWVCPGVSRHQETVVPLTVHGAPLQVAITIDESTPLEAAEALATQALDLYADSRSSLSYCGGLPGGEERWGRLRHEHDLLATTVPVQVTAPPYGVLGKLRFQQIIQPDDVQIEIQMPLREPYTSNPKYPCWIAMAP
jgi:hypothetical protein